MTNENERLKHFRNELNMTQATLSKGLDIKQASLSDVERGKVKVSANLISGLMTKYRLNPYWLVQGKGVMQLTEDQFNLLTSNIIYSVDGQLSTVAEGQEELIGLGKNLFIGKEQYSSYLKCVVSEKNQADLNTMFQILTLPGIYGKSRTFELITNALAPGLSRGDYAVCTPSSLSGLMPNKKYLFVCKQGILAGKGRLKSDGKVKVSPENKKFGKPITIEANEVFEAWEVVMKLTSVLEDPNEERLKALEQIWKKRKKGKKV